MIGARKKQERDEALRLRRAASNPQGEHTPTSEHDDAEAKKEKGAKRERWQDHPIVPWLIENGSVFLLCSLIPQKLPSASPVKTFFHQVLQAYSLQHVMILIQHFLVYRLYAHIPFFGSADKRPASEADARRSSTTGCGPTLSFTSSAALPKSRSSIHSAKTRCTRCAILQNFRSFAFC